jgi:Zn-dependent peptidase ImmA (M78 family)
MIRRKKIRNVVCELLERHGVAGGPVAVDRIARAEGARIHRDALEGELSGFLYRDAGNAIIGVNTHHASVRQRFTVAHELGHLLLHDHDQLHVDYKFRSESSSEGSDPEEIEANLFAAELLMPASFLAEDLEGASIDLADGDLVYELAKKYGVSTQALTIRLVTLGYLPG